jgi:hypothetical protein
LLYARAADAPADSLEAYRVRHSVAKSRQIGKPLFDSRFILSHSSAQARIFARGARGSEGGG